VIVVRQWRARRDRAAMWAACTFGALAAIVVFGQIVPERPDGFVENAAQRLLLAALVLFPYLLYRFTRAFRTASVRLDRVLTGMSAVMVAWTFALPHRLPAAGEPRPTWVWIYLIAFGVDWAVLSGVVAARLWFAGRSEPTVARRRMQTLAVATTSLALAILALVGTNEPDSAAALTAQVLAFVSAVCFWLGLAPPAIVRIMWRRPEQRRLQATIESLMRIATSEEEIVRRVLEPMAAIVGARAVAIRDAGGRFLGRYDRGGSGGEEHATLIDVPMPNGTIVVTTSPYAPFFGVDELNLLRTLGALTSLALDRGRLFAQEREMRIALQRADQLKSDFVALAAHELRTPVTTVHGFVHTLHHLGDRIGEEQQEELKRGLEEQTARLASLVEQLLDLSRLDAEAIAITPRRVNIRRQLEELVGSAVGASEAPVEIRVAEDLEANADPVVLERVVTNLVTNAIRYGEPPVILTAEQHDRHLRISVEDRGAGVPAEFVPALFERFARGPQGRPVRGTGLGLAIARSYARAHRGDLIYHDADPHGARFELVLPAANG
jgi:signal transduction histidine kinase